MRARLGRRCVQAEAISLKPEFLAMLSEQPSNYHSLSLRDVAPRAFGTTVQGGADASITRRDY
jgi:hypothetical protein